MFQSLRSVLDAASDGACLACVFGVEKVGAADSAVARWVKLGQRRVLARNLANFPHLTRKPRFASRSG